MTTDRSLIAVQWVLRSDEVRWQTDKVEVWSNSVGSSCDG
jgi:hypothetical protein